VNYSLADDWEFPANINGDPTHVNDELSAQIIKAKPNTVRIEWYANRASGWKPYSIADLDVVITRFKTAGIVSVIDLHDVTCSNDYTLFNSLVLPWWKQQQVKDLLNKHKGFVIANLANEFGKVKWSETANEATAYTIWLNHYKNAISELRNAGIQVPIMIDGPDCGQNLDAVLQAGNPLNQHDPSHNIIMSAHAYWYQDDAAKMIARTTQIEAATFPIVLGEVANKQDNTNPCEFSISSYTDLLTSCQGKGIGWLAWTWTDDWCSDRRISPTGSFSALSDYGNTIVNNPVFGLSAHAEKLNVACLSNPLPVTLVSFEGMITDDNTILLKWNTARETGFKEFVLERSPDIRRFVPIATVQPLESRFYEYPDKNATSEVYYYRLKMVDNDGSYTYSRIVSVTGLRNKAMIVYPSPTADYIKIDAEEKLFPLRVSVISGTGRTMIFRVLKNAADRISLEEFPAGVYTVTGNEEVIGKIVIGKK
jgi:mannan endo-1,4-beta-mannosidase